MDWKIVVSIVLAGLVLILFKRLRQKTIALKDAEMELRCANTCLVELLRQRRGGTGEYYENNIAVSADTNMTAEDEAEIEDLEFATEHGDLQTT